MNVYLLIMLIRIKESNDNTIHSLYEYLYSSGLFWDTNKSSNQLMFTVLDHLTNILPEIYVGVLRL